VEHGKRHRPCTCSMSDAVVKIDMDPLVERFQPDLVEAWRAGADVRPHPDDGPETREVWSFCEEILKKDDSDIDLEVFSDSAKIFEPKKVRKMVEGSEEPEIELVFPTDEEKVVKLKRWCQKQIDHLVRHREFLPEIQDLLKLEDMSLQTIEDDFEDSSSDKENVEAVKDNEVEVRLKNAKRLKVARGVKVEINKQKFLKDYVAKLPPKPVIVKPLKVKSSQNDANKKRHGFADLSAEELEAKRSMKKCYFKHKLWPCRKCSGCVRPDCGECMYCKDKPKFGGHNIMKQKCIHKKCSNPVVRSCERCTWNL